MILNTFEGKQLPVYGKGENVRDWLYVHDHVEALWAVINNGSIGETYNIGGNNEWRNIDVVRKICDIIADEMQTSPEKLKELIVFVEDRPGHDLRYAIDATKIRNEIGWKPIESFESGLRKTVKWYLQNQDWVDSVKTGRYFKWVEDNYKNRLEIE